MDFLEKEKEILEKKGVGVFAITLFVITACLVLSLKFPVQGAIQDLTRSIFFLLIVPILYIKFILKENLAQFGLNIRKKKAGIFWGSLMFFVSVAIMGALIQKTGFLSHYEVSVRMTKDFSFFLLMMMFFFNIFIFIQEYFFRGFVLSFFERFSGAWAILAQFGLYFLLLLVFRQDLWQLTPNLILAFTGGITAYKSKSMIFSYASGLLFFIFLNAYLVYLARA